MGKEKLKGYFYYKIGTPTMPEDVPKLYAFTFEKELRDAFEFYRDMKYFVRKEFTFSEKAKQELYKTRSSQRIKIGMFETRSSALIGRHYSIVKIACTYGEEMYVFTQADKIYYEIGRTTGFCAILDCFNAFYADAFEKLCARTVRHFYLNAFYQNGHRVSCDELLFGGVKDLSMINGMERNDMRADQFGIFLYLFGDTVNKRIAE